MQHQSPEHDREYSFTDAQSVLVACTHLPARQANAQRGARWIRVRFSNGECHRAIIPGTRLESFTDEELCCSMGILLGCCESFILSSLANWVYLLTTKTGTSPLRIIFHDVAQSCAAEVFSPECLSSWNSQIEEYVACGVGDEPAMFQVCLDRCDLDAMQSICEYPDWARGAFGAAF